MTTKANKLFIFRTTLSLVLLYSSHISSSIEDYYQYNLKPGPSNFGHTGLLETPNARFMDEGAMRLSFSSSFPNEFTSLTASPFSWLEATYRYSEIKNILYGPSSYSRNQSYKDKGFDVKFKLADEGYLLPSIAMGLRDIAGTGLFASEYIVSSKSVGFFDLTAGLGWGKLGSDNNISNPFESIKDSFSDRDSNQGLGGEFNYADWFSGKTALFGGIEYYAKKHGIRFMIEYDSSRPDLSEDNPLEVKSKFNVGLNYQLSDSLNIGFGYERGNQFRVFFSLMGLYSKDTIPKPAPKNVISLSENQKKKSKEDKGLFFRSLNKSLQDESIYIQAANYSETSVDLAVASSRFSSHSRIAGRSARIVSALASQEVDQINIHSMNGDLEVITYSLNRKEFDEATAFNGSPIEILNKSELISASNEPLIEEAEFLPKIDYPAITWSMSPSLKHQIGGPEGFYLGQLSWKTDINIKFKRNLTLYSSFGINIYDTFDNLINFSSSELPHVRSDVQFYLSEGKNNLQRLQLEYLASPLKDIFLRLDLGYFEEMFGGVGGEILYRPFNAKGALGFSMHRVKQRGFKQRFSFRDYTNNTGYISLYYDFPKGISGQLLMGEYLAGDKGATIDLSRRFSSGFMLGIFATKTDVPKEIFGEGSFDKGFYFSIPTQLFYTDFRTGNISFGLHPLTKDGGAILNQFHPLYGILADTNRNSALRDWNDLLD